MSSEPDATSDGHVGASLCWRNARISLVVQVAFIFAWPDIMMKFCKNLTGPCPAPTYLPTYLPYLWETKKEITGWVKVGYYTN